MGDINSKNSQKFICELKSCSYLDTHLVDWSNGNVVAVALGEKIFLWHAVSGDVEVALRYNNER